MILGIGIDITQNNRFTSWLERESLQLSRIFSEQELNICNNFNDQQKIQFYASRLAAKEAFFKAFSAAIVTLQINNKTTNTFDFLFACKHISVLPGDFDIPQVIVDMPEFEKKLEISIPTFKINLSISHEKDYSIAVVTISL
jgi:phosphopantetheine--protein transferase-like protein